MAAVLGAAVRQRFKIISANITACTIPGTRALGHDGRPTRGARSSTQCCRHPDSQGLISHEHCCHQHAWLSRGGSSAGPERILRTEGGAARVGKEKRCVVVWQNFLFNCFVGFFCQGRGVCCSHMSLLDADKGWWDSTRASHGKLLNPCILVYFSSRRWSRASLMLQSQRPLGCPWMSLPVPSAWRVFFREEERGQWLGRSGAERGEDLLSGRRHWGGGGEVGGGYSGWWVAEIRGAISGHLWLV